MERMMVDENFLRLSTCFYWLQVPRTPISLKTAPAAIPKPRGGSRSPPCYPLKGWGPKRPAFVCPTSHLGNA